MRRILLRPSACHAASAVCSNRAATGPERNPEGEIYERAMWCASSSYPSIARTFCCSGALVKRKDFPSGEDLTAAGGYALGNIDARRAAASSRGYVGEGGKIQERWRCPTLLTALYVMLWLDVRERRSFPRCQLEDCGRYFGKGPQDTTLYCSKTCADRVRQRRGRP